MRLKPFWEPQLNQNNTGLEASNVLNVLDSGYWNDGPEVKRFEKALAKRIGVEHVVCTSSGTAALFLALRSLGIDPPQQSASYVGVPDITFIATANAVSLAGGYIQIPGHEPQSLTFVDITVHVSGHRATLLRASHGKPQNIEDSCEAFPMAPSTSMACYSFSPNKIITTGQGGCVATNDGRLASDIRALKDQGRVTTSTGGDDEHPTIGFNFKMTDLQAAVGLAQLNDLERRIERRWMIQTMYESELPVNRFKIDEVPLWTDMEHPDREAIIARVEAAGYQCRRFWKPLSQQPPYLDPTMTTDTSKMFWLPSAFQLTNEDVKKVIAAVQG